MAEDNRRLPLCASRAIEEIQLERNRQNAKWGEQNHDPFTWLGILIEEVGEFSKEALTLRFGNGSVDRVLEEAIHSAAVAQAMVECILRARWEWRNGSDPPTSTVLDGPQNCGVWGCPEDATYIINRESDDPLLVCDYCAGNASMNARHHRITFSLTPIPKRRKSMGVETQDPGKVDPGTAGEPAKVQVPTVGRIVHYQAPEGPLAAIIVKVWNDKTVNLTVFALTGVPFGKTPCTYGPEVAGWLWPERV